MIIGNWASYSKIYRESPFSRCSEIYSHDSVSILLMNRHFGRLRERINKLFENRQSHSQINKRYKVMDFQEVKVEVIALS